VYDEQVVVDHRSEDLALRGGACGGSCPYDATVHLQSESRTKTLRLTLEGLLFVGLPLLVFVPFLISAYHRGILGYDFETWLLPAGRAIADGNSPYPGYGYPPLVAFAMVPFTFVPGPNIVFTVLLVACMPASLWFLGVRDWRCYGIVFVWAPVLAAFQTANVTIPLLLGAAICWHGRDRWKTAAVSGGLTVAAKLLTAPLVIWLAATRRFAGAVGVAVVAGAVSLFLWALLGFSYLGQYPRRMRSIHTIESADSYTLQTLLQDVGLGSGPARVVWTGLALAVVAAVAWFGWKGDDRRSFALCGAAMIIAVPVVWLHSFTFLILTVAVMRPRLSVAWFLPILCVVGTGNGNGTTLQNAGVLAAAALTIVVALAPSRTRSPEPAVEAGQRLPAFAPRRRETIVTEPSSDSSAA
jgi:hypothetical protein